MNQTDLYRAFDEQGVLLYVGISLSAIMRLSAHRRSSGWYGRCARLEITSFPSRSEALAAEIDAIVKENPVFNKAGRGRDERAAQALTRYGDAAMNGHEVVEPIRRPVDLRVRAPFGDYTSTKRGRRLKDSVEAKRTFTRQSWIANGGTGTPSVPWVPSPDKRRRKPDTEPSKIVSGSSDRLAMTVSPWDEWKEIYERRPAHEKLVSQAPMPNHHSGVI